MNKLLWLLLAASITSCSIQKQIKKTATATIFKADAVTHAHIGISIFEPATGKYWYNHQGSQYFVPASNTKIPTCYLAMKYLGDSLPGLRYATSNKNLVVLQPTGDPSFLHPDFTYQPVKVFLDRSFYHTSFIPAIDDNNWSDKHWGSGWSWSDYSATYMAERSPFPIYGNILDLNFKNEEFKTNHPYFDSLLSESYNTYLRLEYKDTAALFTVKRDLSKNEFVLEHSKTAFKTQAIPFATNGIETFKSILSSQYKKPVGLVYKDQQGNYQSITAGIGYTPLQLSPWKTIYTQATDSLLKIMMHRSDNFFAEQTLLMVSNELLHVMDDSKIIDTILSSDFNELPQKPKWVDGSGLSRYNLFTPQDFVTIYGKMLKEFGIERIKRILPTGGTGTLAGLYESATGAIYAKTGTLSGVVALSGFLTTRKNKQLIFSVLVNNNVASASEVRKAIEEFLLKVRENY